MPAKVLVIYVNHECLICECVCVCVCACQCHYFVQRQLVAFTVGISLMAAARYVGMLLQQQQPAWHPAAVHKHTLETNKTQKQTRKSHTRSATHQFGSALCWILTYIWVLVCCYCCFCSHEFAWPAIIFVFRGALIDTIINSVHSYWHRHRSLHHHHSCSPLPSPPQLLLLLLLVLHICVSSSALLSSIAFVRFCGVSFCKMQCNCRLLEWPKQQCRRPGSSNRQHVPTTTNPSPRHHKCICITGIWHAKCNKIVVGV